jgi:hypothetical protein
MADPEKWILSIEARSPAGSSDAWGERALAAIVALGHQPVEARQAGDRLTFQLEVAALNLEGAIVDVLALDRGHGRARLARLEVHLSTSDQSVVGSLVGVAEVAGLLHVTRARVSQLARSRDFPRAAANLASGPVWSLATIEAWARRSPRRRGRPRKQATN